MEPVIISLLMILTFLTINITNPSQQIQRPWPSQAIQHIIQMCTRLRAASSGQAKLKAKREEMVAPVEMAEASVQ
jgi:hypothetical protein